MKKKKNSKDVVKLKQEVIIVFKLYMQLQFLTETTYLKKNEIALVFILQHKVKLTIY